jgi:hypothetical protein
MHPVGLAWNVRLLDPFARIRRHCLGRVQRYASLVVPSLRTNVPQHPPSQVLAEMCFLAPEEATCSSAEQQDTRHEQHQGKGSAERG